MCSFVSADNFFNGVGIAAAAAARVIRFSDRCGVVFKAHRLRVSLNSRLESNKEEEDRQFAEGRRDMRSFVMFTNMCVRFRR